MAKKNRYQVKMISYAGAAATRTAVRYDIVDLTTQRKDWRTEILSYYVMANTENFEDAEEITTALNYYNNRDKD